MTDINAFLLSIENGEILLAEEEFIVAVTEAIAAEMHRQGKTKADLAMHLGKSKAYVTQLLCGSRNMTLRTLADIAFALGRRPEVLFPSDDKDSHWETQAQPVAKVIQLHLQDPSARVAANDSWSSPLRIACGRCG